MATRSISRFVPPTEDVVSDDMACPFCGERRTDCLLVGRDDAIERTTCYRSYRVDDSPQDAPLERRVFA